MQLKRLGLALAVVALALSSAATAAAQNEVSLTISGGKNVPLVEAARRGDLAAVRRLLDQKADVNAQGGDGATALHWASHLDKPELVDLLIQRGANPKSTNRYGVTPLSLAAVNGSAAILEKLLGAGVDPNTSMPEGETALMSAARAGNPAALKALIAGGADVNARDGFRGQTALMWASARNNVEALRVLIGAGADLNARTERGTPARPTASPAATAAQALVSNFDTGRNLFSSPVPTGFTPFLFAVRAGNIEAVKALLDAGANVNDTLSDSTTALIVATANAHWQLADVLLDRGADPNLDAVGWNALHQAVRTRRPNIGFGTPGPVPTGTLDSIHVIKKMIANGVNVNARMGRNGMKDGQRNRLNRLGATPFFLAAKNTDVEAMKVLAAAGADPKVPNADGTTPLMVAAGIAIWNPGEDGGSLAGQEAEVLEAVQMCAELGNDVHATNALGETALHGAAFRGVNAVAEYLASQGAVLDARDTRGWTPLAVANGLTYTDFFKQQVHTAKLLRELMEAKGLSTAAHQVDPKECLDCLQTHVDQQRAVAERDKRMEAEWASRRRTALRP